MTDLGQPIDPTIAAAIATIEQWIKTLRSTVQWDAIGHWQTVDGSAAPLNAKQHVAWAKGRQSLVLKQVFTLPEQLQDYPLAELTARLALTWWAESAQVFVNGALVQEGDLFDHSARVVLSQGASTGESFEVVVKLVSPGHDAGALMRSSLIFEAADGGLDPGFVADEVAVVLGWLRAFEPAGLVGLAAALVPAALAPRPQGERDLKGFRDGLLAYSARIKAHKISLLGHAHLDMAWLWPIEATWRAAERTFESVLKLQADFPAMVFGHTTPLLYEWMAQHRPDLFAAIQGQVAAGYWEPIGGMWVEPELNLLDAESIVRQILYGQRYYQQTFGAISRIAWLPDTFGFCWQLPQLLKQGGMDYFVTQKLRWNDTNRYPHEVFNWRSPDGSEVLSLMSAPIGEGIDPIKLSDYCWEWVKRTGDLNPLWLPGMGDHGGGPTRDMLEIMQRWQRSPFFPELEFTTAEKYLEGLSAIGEIPEGLSAIGEIPEGLSAIAESPYGRAAARPNQGFRIPTIDADLYLELHRGCYTAHADQKAYNRDAQNALYNAELWNTIATIRSDRPYPKQKLESAWKQVLLNQFHDILPGSSIAEVYTAANPAWQAAIQTAETLTQQALQALFDRVSKPEPPMPEALPIVVFNSLNWVRSAIVRIAQPNLANNEHPYLWKIYPHDHQNDLTDCIPAYVEPDAKAWENVWVEFPAIDVPACGYRLYWLVRETLPFDQSEPLVSADPISEYTIENEYLRLEVDPNSGDIVQLWDKRCLLDGQPRSVFSDYANQIELFQDSGQYWDAWNIDPDYAQKPLPPSQHYDVVRMESQYAKELWAVGQGGSRGYILTAGCPWLTIKAQLKGDERHVLQKACFPLNLEADGVTYETAAGAITRTTRPETPEEKAQWEVPGLRWADMTAIDGSYGVSILSDRKHGYDHNPNQIRLTLLRGSEWPDPNADKGTHHFSYGIYPHGGNWQTANTVQKAREFSQPLSAIVATSATHQAIGLLPPEGSFLDFGAAKNLVLMGFKPSEDDPKIYILRCYESLGESATIVPEGIIFQSHQLGDRLNLLEQPIVLAVDRQITPWQIASFQLRSV
jgi:alpha-mannosidase